METRRGRSRALTVMTQFPTRKLRLASDVLDSYRRGGGDPVAGVGAGRRETGRVRSVGWLSDASEATLRSALAEAVPALADQPLLLNERAPSSNPLWWSASAVVGAQFVVKYAWSEVRAVRLWREGVLLDRLGAERSGLLVPELVALIEDPALVVTRLVPGAPLSLDWAANLTSAESHSVAEQLAGFLVELHSLDPIELTSDLPSVRPRAQADTTSLRARFPVLVDEDRGASVLHWCDWVDDVLGRETTPGGEVVVHGDLHGYNQVWDQASATLQAVVDFEETGVEDYHFDLRYLPGLLTPRNLAIAVGNAYSRLSGRPFSIERMMAWNVLTVLGDAMWRTEAEVELPGGGTAADWVDDLQARLLACGLG